MAIVGPTASGKSDVAMSLAVDWKAAILSLDSMQVYREMDIGTAKPTPDERRRVPHEMIDLVDPSEEFSVAEFQRAARAAIAAAGGPVILCGGSGLHFRAVVDPLRFDPHDPEVRAELESRHVDDLRRELLAADPAADEHIDLANPRRVLRAVEVLRLTAATPSDRAADPDRRRVAAYRPELAMTAVGLDPGPDLRPRVEKRLAAMLDAGLMDEVSGLAGRLGRTASQAVGYKELLPVTQGETDLVTARRQAVSATVTLGRRQRTYFRRDPRITWVEWSADPQIRCERVRQVLEEAVA